MAQRSVPALILAFAVVTSHRVSAQDELVPFVVGVWGQGDAIIPFADFDGVRWRSSWPAPEASHLENLTEPRQIPAAWWGRSVFQPIWELVEPDGRRRPLRITGIARAALGSSCSSNLGLKTDAPTDTYQYGTVIAASHLGAIEAVQTLTSKTLDWRSVSALLPGMYRQHEALAWKGVPDQFLPDLSRPRSQPVLDMAFISTDDAGQYLYFESSREVTRRPDQLGDAHSSITGWLWRRSSESAFQTVAVQAATRDADGKGAASLQPLGVVRHAGKRFWLGTLGSYAYSGLTVLDVRRGGVKQLLVVDYPGC